MTTTEATTTDSNYTFTPEGIMYRVHAARDLRDVKGRINVHAGQQGGLVASPNTLNPTSNAWVDAGCRIENPASRVTEYAYLTSVSAGPQTVLAVEGNARIHGCTFRGERVEATDSVYLERVVQESGRLSAFNRANAHRGIFRGRVRLEGDVLIGGCFDEFPRAPHIGTDRTSLTLSFGGIPGDAFITHPNQLLSMHTPWGIATAFRADDGQTLLVNVGCQRADDSADLEEIAREAARSGERKIYYDIARSFWYMVELLTETRVWELQADEAPLGPKCAHCGQKLPDDEDDD